jgi:hypothetical protein
VTGKLTSGDAFKFAKKNSMGSRKFSPEGAVSVKLSDGGGMPFPDNNYSGKVYTFLPLPEEVYFYTPLFVSSFIVRDAKLLLALCKKTM